MIAGVTDIDQPRSLFLPTARQLNWLLIDRLPLRRRGALSALHGDGELDRVARLPGRARHLAVRHVSAAIVLYQHQVFGGVALAAALLNLVRPSIVLVAVALAAAAFGMVLHNADLSALAAGVLILSLARPAPATE